MSRPNTEGLKGKWRIVEMPGFALDVTAPAYIALDGRGGGEIVFNALTATLDCTIATDAADFDWHGSDEVRGDGFVELQLDGSLEGEFAYDNGDDSTLKARPG
ncbi:hypothetical protein A33M_1651 [Rhodovulum sp. PH10]|uniref:hypothetical protein n=1 Tax=Rhodovulum sp. PH10 TaxID=1187851 RepID=UPI00027C22BA|nr:hypothetical protein [Rhodovulum sp. PH10]EJW09307.1 hypothetical protein A33M_1651 [Rhodovulum sp. PH10]